MVNDKITIHDARVHSLKNIDAAIPRDKFVVITGLSGSGKSSLAFDTLYAEEQRRYVESLPAYTYQFLGQMGKPNVGNIDGLSPAISIDQETTSKNSRSTVGTVTEINDYLRLLFTRVGYPICPNDRTEITSWSVDQVADQVTALPEYTKVQVLAPIVVKKKGQHKKIFERIQKEGYARIRVDGEIYDLSEVPELKKNKKHDIAVVIDRIIVGEGIRSRLFDSLETAPQLADGYALVDVIDEEEVLFSEHYACPYCGFTVGGLEPGLSSFSAPFGAHPDCDGLGVKLEVNQDLVIPDGTKTLSQDAIVPWNPISSQHYPQMLAQAYESFSIGLDIPSGELPEERQEVILNGTDDLSHFHYENDFGGVRDVEATFERVSKNIGRRYHDASSDFTHGQIRLYITELACQTCKGYRLSPQALSVQINGMNIGQTNELSIRKAVNFFSNLTLSEQEKVITKPILKEVNSRLSFLENVGLDYLTLGHASETLSGGGTQRIRLATQTESNLSGVLCILDESLIGLHRRDNDRPVDSLKKMRNLDSILIIVEHNESTMWAVDYLIDVEPRAGEQGGRIMAVGTPEEVANDENPLTGKYLSGKKSIPVPKKRHKGNGKTVRIAGTSENNLKNISVKFPLEEFVVVTGVSGSRKSTLVNSVLEKSLTQKLNKNPAKPGKFKTTSGYESIEKIIDIDQNPIGRTPRSNPATYTSVFGDIRRLFVQTNEAKMRSYKKGRFSFNVKDGRCEACRGDEIIKIEMHFLPDVYVPCKVCHSKRYDFETLGMHYRGKSIADILEMTVKDAVEFFKHIPKIHRKLQTIVDVGLGYVMMGQPATTSFGGETQWMRLASELHKISNGKNFYILDEPATRLHSDDIARLLHILQRLVDAGNTVLIIEHNLGVTKTADCIVDLGPEGGEGGGTVLATGTPEEIINVKESYTGHYLKKIVV